MVHLLIDVNLLTLLLLQGDAKRPDYDTGGVYWDLIAEGDSNFVTTTRGDLLTRNATQNIRLGIGTNGSVLKSDGTDVSWGLPSSC